MLQFISVMLATRRTKRDALQKERSNWWQDVQRTALTVQELEQRIKQIPPGMLQFYQQRKFVVFPHVALNSGGLCHFVNSSPALCLKNNSPLASFHHLWLKDTEAESNILFPEENPTWILLSNQWPLAQRILLYAYCSDTLHWFDNTNPVQGLIALRPYLEQYAAQQSVHTLDTLRAWTLAGLVQTQEEFNSLLGSPEPLILHHWETLENIPSV